MKVAQVMKQNVRTCQVQDTMDVPARIMWEYDCGSVPIVDGDSHVVGMITDRDICMAAYTQGGPLRALPVKGAMSKTVFTCQPQDPVEDAERIMQFNQVHRLPVIDPGGRLVGILSLNDLAQEARREAAEEKREIEFAEVGQTFGAVCQPRSSRSIVAAA